MASFDNALNELIAEADLPSYNGYAGEPPSTEAEYNALKTDNNLYEAGIKDEVTPMFKLGVTPPDWVEIQAQMRVEDVRSSRISMYPSIQDQLDQLYWDRKNGTNTWEEGIDAVKAANPKPE